MDGLGESRAWMCFGVCGFIASPFLGCAGLGGNDRNDKTGRLACDQSSATAGKSTRAIRNPWAGTFGGCLGAAQTALM